MVQDGYVRHCIELGQRSDGISCEYVVVGTSTAIFVLSAVIAARSVGLDLQSTGRILWEIPDPTGQRPPEPVGVRLSDLLVLVRGGPKRCRRLTGNQLCRTRSQLPSKGMLE
jgi:hypothetical protein